MSTPIGTYTFLPWLRQGVANSISGTGTVLRPTIDVSLQIEGSPKGGGSPSLQMDCLTDVFHDKIIDALKAAPAGSKISFTNIKASPTNPKDKSIGLMPDMQLTLKDN